jgi:hypothetical protein
MKNDTVPIERPGVFLFRSPTKVTTRLNQDMLVVLTAPFARACGIALLKVDSTTNEVDSELDMLLHKMVMDLNLRPQEVRAKLFGLSNFRKSLITALEKWSDRNQILIACRDLGRSATRSIVVHCDNGLVGVRYAEPVVLSEDRPEFLAPGSAKQRLLNSEIEHRVLILSANKVWRLLARQAVEEYPGFEATAPNDPHQLMAKNNTKNLRWAHVLIFDDLEGSPLVDKFIQRLSAKLPMNAFSWVGTNTPRFAPSVRLLPPIEPTTILDFKRSLSAALLTPTVDLGEPSSQVFSFERKKKIG